MSTEKISTIILLVLVLVYVLLYMISFKEVKEKYKPYILMVKFFISFGACIAAFFAKSYVTSMVAVVFAIVHSYQMLKFKKPQEGKPRMEQPNEVKMGDGSKVQVETPPAEEESSSDIHEGFKYE